ncbi:T9SS type A sorting domain-containing protein [Saprospiraceae bacterium]|nr:T9SS type A sorting domain-containing protein [Saprospiraceae bacterium]
MTITGTGTTWSSSSHCVEFSDGISSFSFVGTASSATTITGTLSIPFGANVSANYDITVYDDTNGACGGASDGTCIDCFEVDTPPQTVSISPSSGEQNSSFAVTLTGIATTWSNSHCVEFSDGVSTFTFVGTASASSTITGTLSIPPGANISADYDIAVYNATNGACSGSLDGLCTDCFEVMIDPALPLELISFTADAIDAKAKLQWKIANPQNVEGYEIHRGVEDQQTGNLKWEIMDFVAHSDSKYIYDFVDETPADGINYYRLKIVDWDKNFEWSPIVSLTFSNREVNLINLFPNPVNPSETLFMSVKTKVSTDIELTIINQSGQIINQSSWKSENQQQLYPIELGQIPGGYYFARIKVGEETTMRTFIVAKE